MAMDISGILKISVVVLAACGWGYVYVRPTARSRRVDDARERGLAKILQVGHVHANDNVRELLTEHTKRRQRWQSVGGGIAGATAWIIGSLGTELLDGASFGGLWIVGLLIGSALGGALSALLPTRSPEAS